MSEPTFTRENIPDYIVFRKYHKRVATGAARIQGPFSVRTREGVITCEDGWLAIDSGGWPYPIAADEFDRIYEAAKEASE